MKVLAESFSEKINNEDIVQKKFKISKEKLLKNESALLPVEDFIKSNVSKNYPASELEINVGSKIIIRIQTNIINIPFSYFKTEEKVIDADHEYDLNIYAILEAENINKSHLRIDKMTSFEDLNKKENIFLTTLHQWVIKQLESL